ncbi:helix-turn-helix domain-containing protein [Sphaerochaeta sp.]|mgnify:FL=1|jgi:transposase|uniref:helix-turn-helix domain-containing protein n=1 Tax=Sphaerochaeta sp. TaxID=1972642 RepID=UPI002FCAD77F
MNNRKFKTDKSTLIQEGKQIVNTTEDGKYIRKVTLVNLMLRGVSASQIGDAAGETTRTLTMWMKSVDEHGFESLRPKKQPGRPSRLSKEQKENIKDDITKDPSVFGYNVWDGNTLSDHIGKSYGVTLQTRQCERLFHELGFSLIRPQTFPAKGEQDSEAREAFKKNSKP